MTQMTNPVLREALLRRTKRLLKQARVLSGRPRGSAQPLFVMGYGRSGTTMLLDAFEHDMRIDVLGENDPRVAENHLLVRERVGSVIQGSRAKAIVLKPILDSFHVHDLMIEHPTSRVIWMLRGFEPVVASAVKKFGTSVSEELREVVVNDTGDGWLKRGLPQTTLDKLRNLQLPLLETNDWMSLVWWSVNITLLSPKLLRNDRFMLVRYEDLTGDPMRWMNRVYEFIGLPMRQGACAWIDPNAARSQTHIAVQEEIRALCDDLAARINVAFPTAET